MSSLSVSDEPSTPAPQPARPTPLQTYLSNRARLYPDVTDEQWNDWKWQQKNRVTSLAELSGLFTFDEVTTARLGDIFELYRTAITPVLPLSDRLRQSERSAAPAVGADG